MSASQHRFFATCAPGLEPWLAKECEQLGRSARALEGGVEFRCSLEEACALAWSTRLAEAVRLRLRSFVARDFPALERGLAGLPMHAYLRPEVPIRIEVVSHRSRLWHSDAIADRWKQQLSRQLKFTPNFDPVASDNPDAVEQRLYLRLTGDAVQPSVDFSGERLHRRGQRRAVAPASLRETLASGLLAMLDELSPDPTQLWDPFAGAGTIALEWLARRGGQLAGANRRLTAESWPVLRAFDGAAMRESLAALRQPSAAAAWVSDKDRRAMAACQTNLEAAQLTADCTCLLEDFESAAVKIPPGCAIVTNPPYGIRLEARAERDALLARFERLLEKRRDLRPALFVLGGPLPRLRLPWKELTRTRNGGLPVTIYALTAPSNGEPVSESSER